MHPRAARAALHAAARSPCAATLDPHPRPWLRRSHFATRDLQTHAKYVKVLGLRGKYILDYARDPFKPGLTIQVK